MNVRISALKTFQNRKIPLITVEVILPFFIYIFLSYTPGSSGKLSENYEFEVKLKISGTKITENVHLMIQFAIFAQVVL